MRRLYAATTLLLLALGARPAHADPTDLLGFGARAAGLANTGAALAKGGAATMYNPGGVALAESPEIEVGYAYGAFGLEINGKDANVVSPSGMQVSLALPVKLAPDLSFAIGFGLFMPDKWVGRIQLVPGNEPRYLLLDNDVNRLVASPVIGLRWGHLLSVGAGVSMFADAAGNGIRFDVGVEGGEKVGRSAIDVDIPTRVAPLFGVLVRPTDRLRVGLAYRGEVDLRLRLDIVANVNVVGVVQGDAIISLRAVNFYTPKRLSLGAAFDVTPDLTLTSDLVYTRWRDYTGGVAELKILVDLGVTPSLASSLFPQDRLSDTFSLRAGAEFRPIAGGTGGPTLTLRGGAAYEPSPIPDQVLATSFADNDRLVLAGGLGVEFPGQKGGVLERPFSLDASGQYHTLFGRQTRKLNATLPSFSSGGSIVSGMLTATARF
jgi:long-chain fatty acid transport protein